ncbi:rhodanese-like domain-containing protein [Bradyrhizobium sp. WD16]|uniref:rhodanese-like domain-containing protein n=1 Tax=Bradyrhizobium sp. WD16 TaxID=1521768 RepID=UPI0020A31CA3|nr:rhodanese-like domain-containing protein [Bradyrhizobium sp. WD16]UTD26174.1 hypothetical protein DB459_03795 [Bradyrhizobium sp. WD16]
MTRPRIPFRRIDCEEFDACRNDGATVFDTRDAAAFAAGHVEGATRLTQANISEILAGLPRTTPVLIYCYRGNASREYAQILSDFGFNDVSSLDGGYEAWRQRRR